MLNSSILKCQRTFSYSEKKVTIDGCLFLLCPSFLDGTQISQLHIQSLVKQLVWERYNAKENSLYF